MLRAIALCYLAVLSQTGISVLKAESTAPVSEFGVPPPSLQNAPAATPLLYSIGNPTDEEQLFLELVNRARMNPAQEGILLRNSTDPQILNYYSFFQVNLDAFTSAMSKILPAQPLAMNAALTAAARIHSLDMFNNTYQEHVSPIDGTGHADRAIAAGYPADAFSIAENIYADARSVIHGHAGFEVDWGNDPSSVNGMQNPPHHRLTMHRRAMVSSAWRYPMDSP